MRKASQKKPVRVKRSRLRDLDILDWKNYSAHFEQADLLLGNGFSINLSPDFRYDSLFAESLNDWQDEEKEIFNNFGTSNFEAIQQELQAAIRVNSLFNLPTGDIEEAVKKLRTGLISAIERKHPRARDIDKEYLWKISKQLAQFSDIFTLNYDLYLYHLIMLVKDRYPSSTEPYIRPYNDYFWRHSGDDAGYLEFVDYQNYSHYKHVYYLHGALFIFSGFFNDLKLRRHGSNELIDCVAEQIKEGKMPLFVSEGNWKDKLSVINHSPYLSFARAKLRNARAKLVIYGASLSSEQDKHIVETLNEQRRDIAVAIYVDNKTEDELRSEVFGFRSKLSPHDVLFFDSSTLFYV